MALHFAILVAAAGVMGTGVNSDVPRAHKRVRGEICPPAIRPCFWGTRAVGTDAPFFFTNRGNSRVENTFFKLQPSANSELRFFPSCSQLRFVPYCMCGRGGFLPEASQLNEGEQL